MYIQFLIVNEGDDVHIFFQSLRKKKKKEEVFLVSI